MKANALLSVLLFPDGRPGQVLRTVLQGHAGYVSLPLAFEYGSVLGRERFERRSTGRGIQRLGQGHLARALVTNAPRRATVLADEADNMVLDCALSCGADAVVSGDRHLLALRSFEGIQIVTPAEFLALSEAAATE